MPENSMPTPDAVQIQIAADILKTVAHPVRLRIIEFLEKGEKAVMEICTRLSSPQPYISQHLTVMKTRGILNSRRNGSHVFYSIANPNVVKIIHCIRQHGSGSPRSGSACAVSDDQPGE